MKSDTGSKQPGTGPKTKALFMISIAAELAGMHPQTLRIYEQKGLITPARTPKNTRLYSQEDIARLKKIQELTEIGMNLAGVVRVLELENKILALHTKIAELNSELEETTNRWQKEVEAVHKSYRRELIPLPKTDIIIRRNR